MRSQTDTPPGGYSFGTGRPAAERLLVVARVFGPVLARVLGDLPPRRWSTAVDLGCGPGSSTADLVRLLRTDRIVGVDASPAFVRAARGRVPGAAFVVGDVTRPLPIARPDLLYARFLLSHLPRPLEVAAGWVAQLGGGGHLVLEEPERIDTDDPTFRRYLRLTTGAVASRGATMLVGPTLAAIGPGDLPPGAQLVVNRAVEHPVAAADAATMFALNLASLRDDPSVRARWTARALDDLADRLDRIRTSPTDAGAPHPPVVWQVRQVVVAATDGARPTHPSADRRTDRCTGVPGGDQGAEG
ncbi:MAG TPA: methyltransferase domain-containing protein [Acidimicrobiales bacterium]